MRFTSIFSAVLVLLASITTSASAAAPTYSTRISLHNLVVSAPTTTTPSGGTGSGTTTPSGTGGSPVLVPDPVPVTAPVAQLSTGSIDFGDVLALSSTNASVLLTNIGDANLTLSGAPSFASSSSNSYSATTSCKASLIPQAFCTTNVKFSPVDLGVFTGTLQVMSNTAGGVSTVAVTGRGTGARFEAQQASARITNLPAFTGVAVDTTSPAQTFDVRNTGNIPGTPALALTSTDFAVTGCATSLTPGQSCTASVTFHPSSGAPSAAAVQLGGNFNNVPTNIDLTGTGTAVPASNWGETLLVRSNWWGVAYGAGKFVTVTDGGVPYTSTDGKTWTKNATVAALAGATAITYANGQFAVMSNTNGSTAGTSMSTSADGITWTKQGTATYGSWRTLAYGNGKYVSADMGLQGLATSTNGTTWTYASTNMHWSQVTFGAGMFLAAPTVGYNTLKTSTDGITWTQISNPLSSSSNYTAVGNLNGRLVVTQDSKIAFSSNGTTWTTSTLPVTVTGIYGARMAYGGGTYIIMGDSKFVTSTDGVNWTAGTLPSAAYSGVTYGNGRFVGSTYNGSSLGYTK